MTIHTRQLQK